MLFFLLALMIQIVSRNLFGLKRTKELYPLIVHLPLMVFLTIRFKCPWYAALSSVATAYQCCQAPRWVGLICGAFFHSKASVYLCYIPALFLLWYALQKYAADPVRNIITRSRKSCMLFGAVPLFYYIFDYSTTIYSNLLYSGSQIVVQIFPSVLSLSYFIFVIIYHAETQKEETLQQERDLMAAQSKQARTEYNMLRQMQDQTRQYRHDMRHHFALLQGLALMGDTEKILHYLQTAESDIDAITPKRYCKNETVNLLLSSFERTAEQSGITLSVEASLPDRLSITDTELCSLLSNSLENALSATGNLSVPQEKTVSVRIMVYKEKLLLSVENPYEGTVVFQDGMPQTEQKNHGYGTRSISAIAEEHGGQALFAADAGVFSLKVMIPLNHSGRSKT